MNMSRKAPVQLHPDDEAYVALKVETGQYENVDAVVQAAIQALKERDEAFEEMLRREALPATALAFTERVDAFCRSLSHASERGTPHPEIRAGLRSVGFERRVTIIYQTTEETVSILRIFYAGRDWHADLDDFLG